MDNVLISVGNQHFDIIYFICWEKEETKRVRGKEESKKYLKPLVTVF